ncbi:MULTISPECIES: nitroreductase family protein [Acidithiobacillus]|uniref:SagB/ThcOx family dehydrogenase n=1 Tax=Acidithiobacillus ferrooxidans TaxID=920 RepID=A0A2W1KDU7_ACIFR|nr:MULTISPECIES: nitroreductase family protein [Acidithiobacillus]MCL4526778.1 nitroreductase family protein [Gammaproteobacteria bacterium]MDA8376017.1 nitroreductase family protein [Planctomycetia bacterium]MBN6744042.1 nitroreductase family protein [Acidithiobacillus sp. MC2.2]MBN6746980.1 nitroreductase family protein [Acidithiobacillus sp. PG05]MBU2772926.1 SagB/ThcOx family dehydrogenase [Acidithiobacillus ferrooxidans]
MDIGEMFLRNIGRPNVKSNITTSYDIGAFNQQYNDSIVTHLPVSGEILDVNLLQCLNSRSSCINFDENDNLNDDDLGYILKNAFGLAPRDGIEKRAYPSGGGFYPVEAYIVKSSNDGEHEFYQYDVNKHALVYYKSLSEGLINSHFTGKTLTILFSINTVYSKANYGELSWLLALLECGHLAQNIYLVCASSGIGCCGIGGVKWDLARSLVGKNRYPAYAMILGYTAKQS